MSIVSWREKTHHKVSCHGVCLYIQIENPKERMVSIVVNGGYWENRREICINIKGMVIVVISIMLTTPW